MYYTPISSHKTRVFVFVRGATTHLNTLALFGRTEMTKLGFCR